MKDLKDMLGKKDKNPNEDEKAAKLAALKDLRAEMRGMMGNDLTDRMNKVTVAADNKEDLKKGLDKAKDLVAKAPGMKDGSLEEHDESPEEEASETPEEEASEHETPDEQGHEDKIAELEKKIAELKALLSK